MPDPIDLNFVSEDVMGGELLQGANTFANVQDLVDQAISRSNGKCIRRLVIAAHGSVGNTGFMVFDVNLTGGQVIDGTFSNRTVNGTEIGEHLARLASHWCKDAIIEVRVCEFGTGDRGTTAMQALSDLAGVPVTAPMDSITSIGALGGLASYWKTVHPTGWDEPVEETFWRGDPDSRPILPMPDPSIARVTGATVTNPAPPPDTVKATGWRIPTAVAVTTVAVGIASFFFTRGGDQPVAAPQPPPAENVVEETVVEETVEEVVPDNDIDVLVGEDDPDDEFLQEEFENPLFFPNLRENPEVFEGDLDGYLLIGNVGDAETIDGAYLPRNYPTELRGPNFSNSSQLSGLSEDSYPGSWIVGSSAFLSSTDAATRETLYNTEFVCGETNGRQITICADGGPIESDQLTVIALFDGAVPVDDTGNQQFTYSLVLDADGDRRNNMAAQPPFDWDTYQGTDYWIELIGENDEWKLQVTDFGAGDQRGETPSNARAVIRDRAIFFIVPLTDLPGTPAGFRTTTFVTELDRMFDPEVSGTDGFPGPPNFGLNPISARLNPIVIDSADG
jgi:hypothetical protein